MMNKMNYPSRSSQQQKYIHVEKDENNEENQNKLFNLLIQEMRELKKEFSLIKTTLKEQQPNMKQKEEDDKNHQIQQLRNQIVEKLEINYKFLNTYYDQTEIKSNEHRLTVGVIKGKYQYYIIPQGYSSIGLSISQYKGYEWMEYKAITDSWIILFHGTTPNSANKIIESGFQIGTNQAYKNSRCRFDGSQCGGGVYFCDNINQCEAYGESVSIHNKKYHLIFMCRVDPEYIKSPIDRPDYYIVSDPTKIRPVQLMFKEAEPS